VYTPLISLGSVGSLTSKIRTPSQPLGSSWVCVSVEPHFGPVCVRSIAVNRSLFSQTTTSFCGPWHLKSVISVGTAGFVMLNIRTPS
jgi:hypothetical protein